jgi:hypothetical protein
MKGISVSYSELQRIKRDAARAWPGDYQQQIAAIKRHCEAYSSKSSKRHRTRPDANPQALQQLKELFEALNGQDRSRFVDWLCHEHERFVDDTALTLAPKVADAALAKPLPRVR